MRKIKINTFKEGNIFTATGNLNILINGKEPVETLVLDNPTEEEVLEVQANPKATRLRTKFKKVDRSKEPHIE